MEKIIKIITLGESAVGKTSIIKRIKCKEKFDENLNPTILIEVFSIKRKYEKKNITMNLQFYDTGGQEKFQSLTLNYIRDSQIILLVFSDIKTLDVLKERWINFYKDNTNIKNPKFILVGNKSDLFGNDRDEIVKKRDAFSEEINAHFITCSAKSADNMDNLERYIIAESKRFIDDEELENKNAVPSVDSSSSNSSNKVKLKNKDISKNKKCSC